MYKLSLETTIMYIHVTNNKVGQNIKHFAESYSSNLMCLNASYILDKINVMNVTLK